MRNSIIARYRKIPIGTIITFAGSIETYNEHLSDCFLICNGQEYSREEYEDLHSVIGTLWGGTGTPNFNVPHLIGRFLRGADPNREVDQDPRYSREDDINDAGNRVGTYQGDQIRSHQHFIGDAGQADWDGTGYASKQRIRHADEGNAHIRTSTFGGSETRPINAAVLFLIRY